MKPRDHSVIRSLAASLAAMAPLLVVLGAADARAQTTGAVFGGAEYGRDWSVSAGAVVARAGAAESRWAVRGILSTGGYDYRSSGRTIDADYDQAELVLLHQRSGSWGYVNLGGGARYTDTRLSPDDAGNDRRGGRWDAVITADGLRRSGAWETGAYGSYGIDMQEYYLRARVTRSLGSPQTRLGVEVVAQGDANYDRQGIAAVALRRMGPLELIVSAGVRGGDGQASIGVVRTF